MALPIRRFLRDRRGNVAMMYALSLPVLMFGAALAIDFTHAAKVRTQLNAAADAAALAALTPSMMQQSNATAQTAATNMFNGEIANIGSLVAGQTNVTISVTNPTNNTLERDVTVSYTAQNADIFAGILGVAAMSLSGTSSAKASLAANINFYLLLDNSPSMALPATQAGITQMISLTPIQDNENGVWNGCAFACHQASTGNSDTQGNPCLKGTTYSTPTVSSGGTAKSYCSSTQGAQIDNYALARRNGIQLRLDALSSGVSSLMSDAQTAQQNAASTPPVYQFAAYTMDSAWQIGMSSSNNYNQLMAMTTNFVSGWSTAASNFGVMEYYANNAQCNSSACTSSGGGGDYATNYDNALDAMNTILPNPGNGTNVSGDTPQEVMFLVTDGVEDEVSTTCSDPLYGTRCQSPINPALCTAIKNRGIRIAVLYTDYFQVTSNSWYESWIAPFQSNIAPQLQSCASSPNLFYEASIGTDLGAALQTLFNTVTETAHLTN